MTPRLWLYLLVLAALWGGSFLFMRISAPELGTMPMAFLRCAIAAGFLGLILCLRGVDPTWRRHWRHIFVLGVVNTAVPFALYAFASQHMGAGVLSVVNATTPMFGALVAFAWLRQPLHGLGVLGIALGFVGVLILADAKSQSSLWPIAAGLGATLMYGIGGSYTRKYVGHIRPLTLACGSLIAASLALLPLALYSLPATLPSTAATVSILGLGLLSTGVGYILYYALLNQAGVHNAMSVTYLIPLFGVLWGAWLLHESISPYLLSGGGLILLGVGLTTGLIKAPSRRLFGQSKGR